MMPGPIIASTGRSLRKCLLNSFIFFLSFFYISQNCINRNYSDRLLILINYGQKSQMILGKDFKNLGEDYIGIGKFSITYDVFHNGKLITINKIFCKECSN